MTDRLEEIRARRKLVGGQHATVWRCEISYEGCNEDIDYLLAEVEKLRAKLRDLEIEIAEESHTPEPRLGPWS